MRKKIAKPASMVINDPAQAAKLKNLRQISELLDNAIKVPGTSIGVGLDPILGLLPGGGDFIGGLMSVYIIYSAAEMGCPKQTLIRMVAHVLFDLLGGTIPMLGDLFDVAWKANSKNMDLLEDHFATPQEATKADWLFVALLLGFLLLIIIAISALSLWGMVALWQWVTQ